MQNESISSPACKKILSKSLEALAKRDSLKNVSFDNHPCYLHEDHRWVLPLIFEAQSLNLIPRPVTMVGFDWHRDGGDVRPSFRKKLAPKSKISFEDVVELCEEDLAKDDGDWIKAGMELGLIGDVVVFGVDDTHIGDFQEYFDVHGKTHQFHTLSRLSEEFAHQGSLVDHLKQPRSSRLWEILDWRVNPSSGHFVFGKSEEKILLDIDLDAFNICWNVYNFPWPSEVWEKEFQSYFVEKSVLGYNARTFFDELLERSGLVTIARESECTDGSAKANLILRKLNKYAFDGRLAL